MQCTNLRFASFLSVRFITAIVVNPPERKHAKRTSVQCKIDPSTMLLECKIGPFTMLLECKIGPSTMLLECKIGPSTTLRVRKSGV